MQVLLVTLISSVETMRPSLSFAPPTTMIEVELTEIRMVVYRLGYFIFLFELVNIDHAYILRKHKLPHSTPLP